MKYIKRIYWWLFVIRLSLRWIPRLNLGRRVWWRGENWMLIQGVCEPLWDLCRGGEVQKYIPESEFRAVQNPVEWWWAFKSGYRFFMTCWYRIWLEQGVEPWMRGCKIWSKKERYERKDAQ